MVDHLRNTLGYQGLIFGTIISNSPPNVQATMDVVDSHAYWKHPVFPHNPWDPVDWTVENESMVNSPGDNTLVGLARQRVRGKPHTVTESQHPSPITYSAEAPLLLAAYGALQDWDGIWLFDYGTGTHDHISGFFDQAHHPTKMANMLLAATLFRRFDLRPARKEVTMKFDPETEIGSVTARGRAWRVGDGSVLGVPPELALVSRLNLSVGPDAAGLEQPPSAPTGNMLAADTGQLVWDTSRWQRGIVKVDTDRTKALVGFIDGRSFDLGGVRIAPGTTEQDWCTVGLTLIEGERFDHPAGGRALMIATGKVENTGMLWKDATRTSVGNNWGQAPTLVEVVPATISLPVSPDRVRVFALDPGGNRQHELNVIDEGGRARFVTTTDEGTLWYEIEIAEGVGATPTILSQPRSITVEPGGEIRLEVGSEGYPSPAIDWFHEGTKVGSGSSMILTDATSAAAGKYHATLTNAAGSIDTRTVEVGVRLLPSESELLVNISTRGWVGTGSDRMIAGFVIAGTGTRELLIRAIGPGLGSFGLTGLLDDPIVEVVNQTAPLLALHANNDWVPTEVNAAIQRTGAFPYDPIDSAADAALIAAFEAGAFTAMVAGNNSGTGVGLVEVFDASQTGPASIIRLKNLSTRGRIESGNAIMIAGFVVEGEVPMPVLIRGIGPALGGFGVNGVLDDPKLQLFKTEDGHSILIAENDNWGDEDTSGIVSDAFATSGAFALPHGSLDAALVIWLEPGVYTAQVSGYPGENGVGLVEVYGL